MSIYLDHNATTAPDPAVLEAMNQVSQTAWGNPSAIHSEGQKAREALEGARNSLARTLGVAKPADIVWTSGGTESNCTVLWGAWTYFNSQPHAIRRQKLIISAGEHPSIEKTAKSMAEQVGIQIVEVPLLKNGTPDLKILETELDDKTFLVSMMTANNETGVLFPVHEIGKMCQEAGILFHTDAVNALGKTPGTIGDIPADFISLSAHKVYGPKGVGVLIWRQPKVIPLLCGGGQERYRRAGTENVSGIVGFAKAAELMEKAGLESIKRTQELRDEFESTMRRHLEPVLIAGEGAPRTCNTSTIGFPGVSGQTLLINLDLEGICVSSGSACSSGSLSPSHVLLAMGYTKEEAKTMLRFSLGRHTTRKDMEHVIQTVSTLVKRTRGH